MDDCYNVEHLECIVGCSERTNYSEDVLYSGLEDLVLKSQASAIPTNFKTSINNSHQGGRDFKPSLYLSDGALQIAFCQCFGKVNER